MESRITKYIDKCPPAISGQGGHNRTFSVACKLMQGFALSIHEAMPYMEHYNQQCEPLWSHKELMHKLTDAAKRSDRRGYGYLNTTEKSSGRVRKARRLKPPIQYTKVKSPKWSGRNAL
jgi:putative DNA primase/helicase